MDNDLLRLKKAISLIAVGLYEKAFKKKPGEYMYSEKLIHGINIFFSLAYRYQTDRFDFNLMHEQAFIKYYAQKPVREWFDGWENTETLNLEDQAFYFLGALVEDTGFNIFYVNEDCVDYLECVEKDILAGLEQWEVYSLLMELDQADYVLLRKFLIEHPVISMDHFRKVKSEYFENDKATQLLENAYEIILDDYYLCPRCGWTMIRTKNKMVCQDSSCISTVYLPNELQRITPKGERLRLKRGVMARFIFPMNCNGLLQKERDCD